MRTIIPMSLNAINHDLRTPLVGILGMASFLIKEQLTFAQNEYAAIILNEARPLLDVVNAITSSSHNEFNTLDSKPTPSLIPSTAQAVIKCRVLLVEDSQIIQRVHGGMLRKIGCQFDIAANAKQALSMVFNADGEANYDVILMDIELGEGMNGIEAAAQIRQHKNGGKICIIVLSAVAEEAMQKEDHLVAKIDKFANKPIGIEKLKEIIYGEIMS